MVLLFILVIVSGCAEHRVGTLECSKDGVVVFQQENITRWIILDNVLRAKGPNVEVIREVSTLETCVVLYRSSK